jgi:hypothetical protein
MDLLTGLCGRWAPGDRLARHLGDQGLSALPAVGRAPAVEGAARRAGSGWKDLKDRYTIVIVTHNMQQAARVADRTAFFSLDVRNGVRAGALVEYGETTAIFPRPSDNRTHDYVTGGFG